MRSYTLNYKIGDTLGGYTLLAECGKGAYGSVFLAENTFTGQKLALKIIYKTGRNCSREAKGLIKYQTLCRHTNLLQIYHVEEKDDFFFYTMDAADNGNPDGIYIPDTLANRLKKCDRLAPEIVREMAKGLLADLKELHQKGLFHRDIKPDNILWIDGKATLGDIGLVTDSSQTLLAGTPGFITPEVLAGTREYEGKDDFYALGKTIYCAVTGLPATQYPQFPESGTLTGTGELIQLYNKLCNGEKVEIRQSESKRCKIGYRVGIAALFLIVSVMFFYFLLNHSMLKLPEIFTKKTVPVESSSDVAYGQKNLQKTSPESAIPTISQRKTAFTVEKFNFPNPTVKEKKQIENLSKILRKEWDDYLAEFRKLPKQPQNKLVLTNGTPMDVEEMHKSNLRVLQMIENHNKEKLPLLPEFAKIFVYYFGEILDYQPDKKYFSNPVNGGYPFETKLLYFCNEIISRANEGPKNYVSSYFHSTDPEETRKIQLYFLFKSMRRSYWLATNLLGHYPRPALLEKDIQKLISVLDVPTVKK